MDYLKEREVEAQCRRHLDDTLNPDIALRKTAYDDQGKLPCDRDTRIESLADITNWVNDVSSKSQNFFWMTGDPGCGKSAIAASLARYCKDERILWAQFFISRNDETTTNPRVYFPSIAHQMAKHSSGSTVSKAIYDILQARPSLLDGISNDQALEFFVEVVRVACDVKKSKPVVIVIDGLDETKRKSLEDTATIFSGLFRKLQRPNAKIFISSRTDNEITKPFFRSLQCNHSYVKHVHLDTSDPSCLEDVSRYLSRKIGKLTEDNNLKLEIWPGRERFETLCIRAAGLFIWAVTVVKFFEDQLGLFGHERLNHLLDAINAEGMEDVNKLYQTILNITYASNVKTDWHAWAHETFRWVVGFIVALKEPLPIGDIGTLLDLRRTSTSDPVDILNLTSKLRTVLVAGTGEITKDTIPRLHKSFVEFITSKRADEQFRIDPGVVDVEIGLKCLRLVSRLKNDNNRSRTPPASVRYAIQNWTRHLPDDGIPSGVAVFEGEGQAFPAPAVLRKSFMSFSGDYLTHMYDPRQGNRDSTIKVGSRVYAVAISMDGRLIASGDHSGDVCLWDSKSYKRIGKPLLHAGSVRSVCFTPDSRWLVSGSDPKIVHVWDCKTGQAVGNLYMGPGHSSYGLWSLCTDGVLIISGIFDDKTICIWDLISRTQIGSPIDAGGYVEAVALSNDGRIAAGVGCAVCVWGVKSRCRIASMNGHRDRVFTVAFSPDNSRIASGSDDCSIRLWDTQTYTQIGVFIGHSALSVSFSHDGERIASGGCDMTVRVWHCNASEFGPPLQGHTGFVKSVAFSPDSCRLITGSFDGTVRVWSKFPRKEWPKMSEQITTIHLRLSPPLEDSSPVVSACHSPDRTLYVSSTLNGRVSLWNPAHDLVWESDTLIHPIHLLRLTANQLIISSPDGSVWAWDMVEGKPTHQTPASSGPQLNTTNIHQFSMRSSSSTENPIVRWIPFKVDAGLWAYVDNTFIRFETVGDGSVTFIDVGDIVR